MYRGFIYGQSKMKRWNILPYKHVLPNGTYFIEDEHAEK
jgi:hypothetical protein